MEVKIAIIDADLIGRKNHRFPNLVCMKLSGYYKEMGGGSHTKDRLWRTRRIRQSIRCKGIYGYSSTQ